MVHTSGVEYYSASNYLVGVHLNKAFRSTDDTELWPLRFLVLHLLPSRSTSRKGLWKLILEYWE